MVGESHVCAPGFDVGIRSRFNYCGVAVLAFSYLALPALIVGWPGRLSSKSVWMATLIVFSSALSKLRCDGGARQETTCLIPPRGGSFRASRTEVLLAQGFQGASGLFVERHFCCMCMVALMSRAAHV